MKVLKTEEFLADIESQFEWYVSNGGWDLAERYLSAVEASCQLLGRQPSVGPRGDFTDPRLNGWRFFTIARPFHKLFL